MSRLALAWCLAASACGCGGGGSSSGQEDVAVFVMRVRGQPASEDFRIRIADPNSQRLARAQLALPEGNRRLSPEGKVRRGNDGHNAPWRWHLAEPRLGEIHAEACDGMPSDVERDVAYWADRLGFFCPWDAYVLREEAA